MRERAEQVWEQEKVARGGRAWHIHKGNGRKHVGAMKGLMWNKDIVLMRKKAKQTY